MRRRRQRHVDLLRHGDMDFIAEFRRRLVVLDIVDARLGRLRMRQCFKGHVS